MKLKRILAIFISLIAFTTIAFSLTGCNDKKEPYKAKKLQNESEYERVFYVSNEAGDDNAAGTWDAPFKTLERAQVAVTSVNQNMQKDIAVVVRRGTYTLSKTLTFDNRDGGTNGHNVVYMGYPGETASLSGGVKFSNWQKAGNLYYVSVNASEIRNMWVDGQRATLARHPNGVEYAQTADVKYTELNGGTVRKVQQITAKLEDLKGAESFEAVCYMEWSQPILRVQSITKSGNNAILNVGKEEQAAFFNSNWTYPQVRPNMYIYYQNAKEFLDHEGEFYYDKEEKRLYYYPLKGQNMKDVEVYVSNLDSIVSVKGSDIYNPVQNISFENLTFEHNTTSMIAKNGYREIQSAHYTDPKTLQTDIMRAAVVVDCAKNINFEGCTVQHTGSGGMLFLTGVSNSAIRGNVFFDTAAYAVTVSPDVPSYVGRRMYDAAAKPYTCHDIDIDNNYVTWSGVVYPRSAAIASMHGYKINITNNEIGWVSYTGISVGWGWSLNEYHARENYIARNNVHNFGMYGSDLGGIYTLNNQPGTIIEENYIHECASTMMGYSDGACVEGIYLDEGSNNMIVRNNQIAYASRNRDLIMYHVAGNNIVEEGNMRALQGEELNADIVAAAGPIEKYRDRAPYNAETGGAKVYTSNGRQVCEGGVYGYKMKAEKDMTLYGLGRFYILGNCQEHKLSIYDKDKNLIATCVVDMSEGKVDKYGYKYARFKKPIQLKSGEEYYISSEEHAGGDWYLFTNTSLRIEGCTVLGIARGEKLTHIKDILNNSAFIGINLLLK